MMVPQLSEVIGSDGTGLPNFFVLHPLTGNVVAYPFELEDPNLLSPESVLLWARRTTLYLEVEHFEK